MLLRLATHLSRPSAAGLERRRIPWILILALAVVAANVAAALFTLVGQ